MSPYSIRGRVFNVGKLRHLGGFGLVILGVADNSVIPLPGSMDVLTIWLAASNRHLWWYYGQWPRWARFSAATLHTVWLVRVVRSFRTKLSKRRRRKSMNDLSVGILRGCDSGVAAAALSDCAIFAGGGRDAVLAQEVFGCAGRGSGNPVRHCGWPRRVVWHAHRPFLLPILQTRFGPD